MSELPVIDRTYDFALWLKGQVGRFPREQRFGFGHRLESHVLDVLESLVEARYTPDRRAALEQANRRLQSLRYLVRMAHDLKLLDTRRYGFAAGCIDDVGRQIGAWIRSGPSST